MLYKAIEHGKEKRKPYYGASKVFRSCRCHGGCPWCLSNRLHSDTVHRTAADEQIEEYLIEGDEENES